MKLKDLHTNLEKEINLLKFYPKKEISVDSFLIDKNIIQDISQNKIKQNINLKNNSDIKVKKINKKNNFDSLNFNKKDINIDLHLKIKKNKKISYFKKNKSIFKFPKFFIYFLFFIFIIFTNKIAVEYFTNSWYKKIIDLKNNNSEENLKSAKLDFMISNILFKPFSIIPLQKIKNADNAILWGLKVTNLLLELQNFQNGVNQLIEKKWIWNIMFSQLLFNNKKLFKYTEKEIWEIIKIYNNIYLKDNKDLQLKLNFFKWKLNEIQFYNKVINDNFQTFLNTLWHNKRKKYLIVFQNNDEIRPQWGFMWSMWIVEIFRWKIKKFEKKDVYNYEFKIKKENFIRENAPKWLNKLTPKLGLRDSNYFIDIQKSSEKIKFFIEKSWYEIDGIIYINQNSLFKILNLVWEFDSKVLNTKINSLNFSLIMSSLVESKKSHIGTLWTPKQVLFDFMEEFKQILKTKKINNIDVVKILLDDIKNREIIFYNFNELKRDLLEQLWLFNPIKYNETLDFNYPVFTSISWNKSDRFININFNKSIIKWEECSYIINFEIKLEHLFNKKDEKEILNTFKKFWIKEDISRLLYIQWKWTNKQFIRVVIPINAIIQNKQYSIFKQDKNTKTIDFFLNTNRWEKSSYNIKYILPNINCKLYNYKIYKQPWVRKYNLNLNIFWERKKFTNIKNDLFIN